MSCGGLNQFIPLTVPGNNGDGPAIDVSALVANKTIYLAGEFSGSYVVLVTHDDVNYVPLIAFSGGQGPQPIRRDVVATVKSIKIRRNADRAVTMSVAGQATCACS